MRLFVALDLPEGVREELRELIARLKKHFPSARWVRAEGIHITVKFIGYTDEENFEPICGALAQIRLERLVEMEFRGLGFSPNERRPRVLWCGVKASSNLPKLASDIEQALEPLGIERESREFVPHLTLARLESGGGSGTHIQKLVQAAGELADKGFGSATETEFYLYESVLKRSGAKYKRLRAFPFVKGSA